MLKDTMFWMSISIGLLGILGWMLKTWRDPKDDRIGASLYAAFYLHSTSLVVSLITYVGACIGLYESKMLTPFQAFTMGFMIHSVSESFFTPKSLPAPKD